MALMLNVKAEIVKNIQVGEGDTGVPGSTSSAADPRTLSSRAGHFVT